MPTVTVNEGEIYYESHGEGPPVLLVPGLGGLGSYWGPNIPAFTASNQVIIHDHRGLGRSSRSLIRYSVDQMTEDLVAVMDHLGIEKAHLVGHSTGGAIGQTLAITRPDLHIAWPSLKCRDRVCWLMVAIRVILTIQNAIGVRQKVCRKVRSELKGPRLRVRRMSRKGKH